MYPEIIILEEQRKYTNESFQNVEKDGRIKDLDKHKGQELDFERRAEGFLAEVCMADLTKNPRPQWGKGDPGWDQIIFKKKTDIFLTTGNFEPRSSFSHKIPSLKFGYDAFIQKIPNPEQLHPKAESYLGLHLNLEKPDRFRITGFISGKEIIELYKKGIIEFKIRGSFVPPFGKSPNNLLLIPFSNFHQVSLEDFSLQYPLL